MIGLFNPIILLFSEQQTANYLLKSKKE